MTLLNRFKKEYSTVKTCKIKLITKVTLHVIFASPLALSLQLCKMEVDGSHSFIKPLTGRPLSVCHRAAPGERSWPSNSRGHGATSYKLTARTLFRSSVPSAPATLEEPPSPV